MKNIKLLTPCSLQIILLSIIMIVQYHCLCLETKCIYRSVGLIIVQRSNPDNTNSRHALCCGVRLKKKGFTLIVILSRRKQSSSNCTRCIFIVVSSLAVQAKPLNKVMISYMLWTSSMPGLLYVL